MKLGPTATKKALMAYRMNKSGAGKREIANALDVKMTTAKTYIGMGHKLYADRAAHARATLDARRGARTDAPVAKQVRPMSAAKTAPTPTSKLTADDFRATQRVADALFALPNELRNIAIALATDY